MSVQASELTPDLEIQILNKLHFGTLQIGDKLPLLEPESTVSNMKVKPRTHYRELIITQKLITQLESKVANR